MSISKFKPCSPDEWWMTILFLSWFFRPYDMDRHTWYLVSRECMFSIRECMFNKSYDKVFNLAFMFNMVAIIDNEIMWNSANNYT